jgi:threonine dehydrogenase-like Zn-dependent dehydrogenase
VSTVDSPITVPDEVGLLEAPASHDDGSTAIGLMEGAAVQPGEWVLVEAEGGGVGSLLVQLAVAVGTQVVGAARRPAKLDLACELGAKAVVDYPPSPLPRACARWRATSGGWWRCGCCRAPRPGCRPAQDLEVQRRDQLPDATTVVNILQRVGGAVGGALFAVVLSQALPGGAVSAFRSAFWWVSGASALAVGSTVWLWLAQRAARTVDSPLATVADRLQEADGGAERAG